MYNIWLVNEKGNTIDLNGSKYIVGDGDFDGTAFSTNQSEYSSGSFRKLYNSSNANPDIALTIRVLDGQQGEAYRAMNELELFIANAGQLRIAYSNGNYYLQRDVTIKSRSSLYVGENNVLQADYVFSSETPWYENTSFEKSTGNPKGTESALNGFVFKANGNAVVFGVKYNDDSKTNDVFNSLRASASEASMSPNPYKIGETYITGTYTGDIYYAVGFVNGENIGSGGTFENGEFSFFVDPALIKRNDVIVLEAHDKNYNKIATATVPIYVPEIIHYGIVFNNSFNGFTEQSLVYDDDSRAFSGNDTPFRMTISNLKKGDTYVDFTMSITSTKVRKFTLHIPNVLVDDTTVLHFDSTDLNRAMYLENSTGDVNKVSMYVEDPLTDIFLKFEDGAHNALSISNGKIESIDILNVTEVI